MSALTIRGLHKAFGPVHVLRGLDLDVPTGALAAVLGPSGCGKTTLLRVVAGFEHLDSGTVTVGGELVGSATMSKPPERRRVTVVPQEGALFPHLDVAANVAFGLGRMPRRRERVHELLDLVGLADFGRRMPAELSGGQQQRVAVARALAPDPQLVLLDEPFSALDAGLRATVRADVRAALAAAGATAVLVTHDQEEALSVADLVAVLRGGVVVQSGAPEVVYREPRDLDVARFVGESVELAATVTAGVATTALGRVAIRPTASSGSGTVVLRPEQIMVAGPGEGTPALVRQRVFYGHDTSIVLEVTPPGAAPLRVLCRTQDAVPADDGEITVRVVGAATFFPGASSPG